MKATPPCNTVVNVYYCINNRITQYLFTFKRSSAAEDGINAITSFTAPGRVCFEVARVSLTSIVLFYVLRNKMLQFVRSINNCTK